MKKLFVVLTIMMSGFVQAQKMKVVSGNFDFLKGQTELNLVMDYSSMKFYKENMDENAYIKKREKDILDSDKDQAEVENWKKDWEHSKNVRFVEKRSEEHTSELQSRPHLVCRLLLEKK